MNPDTVFFIDIYQIKKDMKASTLISLITVGERVMGKIKGCDNESCEAHKKKITYKEPEAF